MTVPRGNVRITRNAGRIRSRIPLRPTFVNKETWYCGTAIAVPYVKLHTKFSVPSSQGRPYANVRRRKISVFSRKIPFTPGGHLW